MADVQKENGYVSIANALAEKMCEYRLSGQEWQILWVILRKTYGWNKKEDRIALSQFSRFTKINRSKCHHILQSLVDRNIVTRRVAHIGNTKLIYYGIQKDFDQWKVLPKRSTGGGVAQKVNKVLPKRSTKVLPKKATTKDNKTTTKDNRSADHGFRHDGVLYYRLKERFGRFYWVVHKQPYPGLTEEKKWIKIMQQLYRKFQDPYLWAQHSSSQYRHTCRIVQLFFRIALARGWKISPLNLLDKVDSLQLILTKGTDGMYSKDQIAANEEILAKAIRFLEKSPGLKSTVKVLRVLPEYMHGEIRNWLNRKYQGSHSYFQAKEIISKEKEGK